MGQSPCFGGFQASRRSNAAATQESGPPNTAATHEAGPSNVAGSQEAGPSNAAGTQGIAVGNIPAINITALIVATKNFSKNERIGEGGSALVYKGTLPDGQTVAVKRLKPQPSRDDSFNNEVGVLCHLNHPNIIGLIGCCVDGNTERMIVYEYMPLGTLHDHLHERKPGQHPLSWENRMRIGAGIARGLNYLHNEANPPVIYRDLKPRNVLLDANYNPKISDFGISIALPPDGQTTSVATKVLIGTPPYWAPEDALVDKLYIKSDIYGFGVVLLNIITGIVKRNPSYENYIDDEVMDPMTFVEQADPEMNGAFPEEEVVKAMTVATKCINLRPSSRPDIGVVVNAMNNLAGDQNAEWPEIFSTVGIIPRSVPNRRRSQSVLS